MVTRALLAILLSAGISTAQPGTAAPLEPLSVPAGTMLHCRTTQTLTTKINARGDAFYFTVSEPVTLNGRLAIPAGSIAAGRITLLERPGRIRGVGQMQLTLYRLNLPDGRSFPVAADLMAADGLEHVKVGGEGLVKGPNSRFADFEEIGAGTAGGTILGLIFAHPVVGATLGLTATTVDRLRRRGKDLTVPVGTEVSYQLTRDLAMAGEAPHTTAAIRLQDGGR